MAFDIWVDFNAMHDGLVQSLAAFARPHAALAPGHAVVVGDDDGTIAQARIESIEGDVVTLRIDTTSFVADTETHVGLAQ